MRQYVVERDAIVHNLEVLKKKAGDSVLWAVLKGDGYGLGLESMAELCLQCSVSSFAVTEPWEAETLRRLSADCNILMLRPTAEPAVLSRLLDLDVIATVDSVATAAALNSLAGQRGQIAQVHVKIDTGMGRYGFLPEERDLILSVYRCHDNLAVTGIYTHFHSAFCSKSATFAQYAALQTAVEAVISAGVEPGMVHCCNSNALLRWPELKAGGARVGSALLGRVAARSSLHPTGYCEATVEQIRWLPKGHSTGYGAAWKAKRPTRIAVIPVGWYHGFTAQYGSDIFRVRDCLRDILTAARRIVFKKRLYVSIGGRQCPVLGHVGMLHTVCDVTQAPCQVGETARLEISPTMVRGMDIVFRP